jgi:hypothetical protein
VAEHFLPANIVVSRQENGLDSDIWGKFRRKPEFSPFEHPAAF